MARMMTSPKLRPTRIWNDVPRLRLELIGKGNKPRLHPECGVAAAYSMALVTDCGAEQPHDPVAHGFVNRSLLMMDSFYHMLENLVQDHTGVLGAIFSKDCR